MSLSLNALELIRDIKARLAAAGVDAGDDALDALAAQCGTLSEEEAGAVVELLQIQMRALNDGPIAFTAPQVVAQLEEIWRRVCVVPLGSPVRS